MPEWSTDTGKSDRQALRVQVADAGGWAKVLPAYLAAKPRRTGLLLSEFLALGLMDRAPEETRTFLGSFGAARLALQLNRLSNRRGIIGDKLLADAMFRGAGLEAPETLAVFGRPAPPNATHLRSPADLAAFLAQSGPVFGKPAQGDRGVDTIAIDGVVDDLAQSLDGQPIAVDKIWERLDKTYRGGGFVFQRKIVQHQKVTQLVGPTAATVRVMTVLSRGKVHLHSCLWRIPLGSAIADNFSQGGLLAPVDPESGRIGAAISAFRVNGPLISQHPTTGAAFEGVILPRWLKVKKTVRAAAGMMHVLPVIGWDIAIAPHGPIIVEANASPSLEAPQYLSGQGALSGEGGALLKQVLADVTGDVAAHKKRKRAIRRGRAKRWLSKH